jgi:hypothetical protein
MYMYVCQVYVCQVYNIFTLLDTLREFLLKTVTLTQNTFYGKNKDTTKRKRKKKHYIISLINNRTELFS